MFLRKAHAGNVPGYTWENDGQVIEVDDALAEDLLDMPNGGFSIAEPPTEPEEEPETPEAFDEVFNSGEPVEVPDSPEDPKRSPGRPRLPRGKDGKIIRS